MSANKPKLSICIPNYNRGPYIGETLQSIAGQIVAGVEVVINDNASTDESSEVITAFQKRFPWISCYRSEKNLGFDKNVLKVVELAQGEYCWLLGSDDCLEPGGLKAVLSALNDYPHLSGISLGYVPYGSDLQKRGVEWDPTFGKYNKTTLFKNKDECFSVLGHYIGLFSAQVVNRDAWMKVFATGSWKDYCKGFVHVYMIGGIIKERSNWLFLPQQCVGWRGGNDVHLKKFGYYDRLRYDLEGSDEIFMSLLGSSAPAYKKIMSTGAAVHASAQVLNARLAGINSATRLKMAKLCFRYYGRYLSFWTNILPLFILPVPILHLMKRGAQLFKKTFWKPKKLTEVD